MDYLQYNGNNQYGMTYKASFKPYYKWITFNTISLLRIELNVNSWF